ncbi:glycogen/starch/alpha-glucan phosphorylase [Mahella sp.]|uniref:glycogen/starch/alpha-glucan phosphorylase n=1 Tax=Mahella sp. TaxID=2798721 RepID=UPI0025C14039|nr:glycogen/starch/alpha-glucan phosphorylase [Mahella sp.]MBZ4666640.1 glycogen/starch/alpha-glucan phosphorylase [Mahella sp.]
MLLNINKDKFKSDYQEKFIEINGKELSEGADYDKYEALAGLIRDYIAKLWVASNKKCSSSHQKQVYYFSMEFLLGRLLGTTLLNLGIRDMCKEALSELGIDLDKLEELEEDQGLGNGGLGRLAACFLDSMASLNIYGHGCGIRYKYGFFEQKIIDGAQVEAPDDWLKNGNVWEIKKPDEAEIVKFGGHVDMINQGGRLMFYQRDYEPVMAVPYDIPVVGYENGTVNTLRLWSAEPVEDEFDFSSFSRGEYSKAVDYRNSVEAISQVLYPDDTFYEGRKLRLKQQYFFVSAGIQSIIKKFKACGGNIRELDDSIAVHINDTHPALAIPELMRILMDEEGLGWDEAWRITTDVMSFTNHTVMPEAMEKWPVSMFQELLPRIYMIVNEINERFCGQLWNLYTGQWDKIARMAIIADGYVRMAHLAVIGSHSVNGVAKLHTEILKKEVMADFYYLDPKKFNNKTNGITHRRWLMKANPGLTSLLMQTIGDSWIRHPIDLARFERYAYDGAVQAEVEGIKKANKERLARYIKEHNDIAVDPSSMFDSHIKRIHAYKRQTLNCLRIMDLYNRLIDNPHLNIVPRTFIFAGKAAPGYYLAKNIIELINAIADKVNNDPKVNDLIKVVFLENYRVSLAEAVIPASDLSEQISTTTKEASGTSNMKFMMNGAVTIATLDGANIEIRDEVGDDNIVIFGLTSKEVLNYYRNGGYSAADVIEAAPALKRVLDDLINGKYSKDKDKFRAIYDSLTVYNDEFFVLKDFVPYLEAQARVDEMFEDRAKWNKMAIVNIAHSGIFSSDRTIEEYAVGIWGSNYLYKNL